MNLSKCILRTLSMPPGRLGKTPEGLFHTLCFSSQKHLEHSSIKFIDDGESFRGWFIIKRICVSPFYYFLLLLYNLNFSKPYKSIFCINRMKIHSFMAIEQKW